MNQTCMCWGFCIGKGWYYHLNKLCSRLDLIQKRTGIKVSWLQIKEKYASGRFYHNIKYGCTFHSTIMLKRDENDGMISIVAMLLLNGAYRFLDFIAEICYKIFNKMFYRMTKEKLDIWANIIDELISNAESFVGHTCEETGKYIDEPIDMGNWVYALSEEGFLLAHPDRKDVLKEWKKYKKEKEKINDGILDLDDSKTEELKKFLKVK